MRTRAERRHNNQRVKNKFYKSLRQMDWNSVEDASNRAKFYNTRHPCSCYMCCSPRSKNSWYSGKDRLTIQERKFDAGMEKE